MERTIGNVKISFNPEGIRGLTVEEFLAIHKGAVVFRDIPPKDLNKFLREVYKEIKGGE